MAILAIGFASLAAATESRQAYEAYTLPGWAARLRIPIHSSKAQSLGKSIAGTTKLGENGGSPSLVLSKYAVSKAYEWLFKEAEEIVEAVVEGKTTVWKDTAPRFVVYGDEYGHNTSLGLPDPASLRGVTHFLLPFWTTKDGITESMLQWTHSTAAERKAIVHEYNTHGIRIGMSAFFADTGKPNAMAKRMAKFAKKYQFQGVNVDYKDYDLFENGNATAWLVPLARRMRIELPIEDGYFLSHARESITLT